MTTEQKAGVIEDILMCTPITGASLKKDLTEETADFWADITDVLPSGAVAYYEAEGQTTGFLNLVDLSDDTLLDLLQMLKNGDFIEDSPAYSE